MRFLIRLFRSLLAFTLILGALLALITIFTGAGWMGLVAAIALFLFAGWVAPETPDDKKKQKKTSEKSKRTAEIQNSRNTESKPSRKAIQRCCETKSNSSLFAGKRLR